MSYALAALGSIGGGLLAAIGLLYAGKRWATRYRQAPATVDTNETADITTAILNADPAEVDEWTTDLELERRDHLALNGVETELRDGLDDAYDRFLAVLGVAVEDLIEQPGFVGVRELVGGP